ncbi:glycine betaine ABC transporter substrate-binding protein [Brevibacterium renqingii]|uniref:glycine betaine ABC transporter substrate-binding protein n=1 Tax=Brevibacterium renqingii TaxID=2776916 RepID=UPI001ADFF1F6|nr:glycine betaine ABC transporter substrate-binding protein [Brevibacterium renqingii]
MVRSTILKAGSLIAASLLTLSACGVSNSGGGEGDSADSTAGDKDWTACEPGSDSEDLDSLDPDDDKNVTFAVFNGWDETYASVYTLTNLLERDGYTVEIKELEAGPAYQAVAVGDVDFHMDMMMPTTHASYYETVKDDVDIQGCWYGAAQNTIAVNEDSPAKTIEDLKTMADDYGNTLYGIEAGAGLTKATKEKVIPDYGLEQLEYKISSTPAMLAQVKKSTDAGDNIAVTLWHPHWAYSKFPMRDLEDPKNSLGDKEILYNLGNKDSVKKFPYVAQAVKNFAMTEDQLADLEALMFSEDEYNGENLEDAVAEWLDENPDFVDDFRAGKLVG